MTQLLEHMPLASILLTAFSGWAAYSLYKVIYRLLFHPLRSFPGPKVAAATFWYEVYYDVFKQPGGQFVFHLDELHDKYGPIVRCSPEEIHIRDSEWFDTLYTGPSHVRDKWERSNRAAGSPGSLIQAWTHDHHRARRGPLNPFFSKRAINELESSVRSKTEKLCAKLLRYDKTDKIVELNTAFAAMTLDVISEYCYDQCQNVLDEADFGPRWKKLMSGLFDQVSISKHFPAIKQMLQKLPRPIVKFISPDMAPFFEGQDVITAKAEEVWLEEKEKGKIGKFVTGSEKPKTIFHGILQSDLPEHEKSLSRLKDEAFVLIVAGTETTARVITVILTYLLRDRELLLSLRKELDAVVGIDSLPTSSTLDRIPLMKAVVQEGLRIASPIAGRPALIAPNEDLTYGNWLIPRGTPTSLTLRNVLFDPKIFPDPSSFTPDRWLHPTIPKPERFLVTFNKGTRACIGQNVAYAEIYLAIAAIIARFDMQLVDFDPKRDLEIVRDCFIGKQSRESEGVRVKVMRRRE